MTRADRLRQFVIQGNVDETIVLLQQSKDEDIVNVPSAQQQYALHFASLITTPNSLKLVSLLLSNAPHPAIVTVKDGSGWTPVQYAIYQKNIPVIKYYRECRLLDNEADSDFARKNTCDIFESIDVAGKCRKCGLDFLFKPDRECNSCSKASSRRVSFRGLGCRYDSKACNSWPTTCPVCEMDFCDFHQYHRHFKSLIPNKSRQCQISCCYNTATTDSAFCSFHTTYLRPMLR